MGMGMGWDGRKSLKGVILRAPLCGANNTTYCFMGHMGSKIHISFAQFKLTRHAPSFISENFQSVS